jgi:hypothetical protein
MHGFMIAAKEPCPRARTENRKPLLVGAAGPVGDCSARLMNGPQSKAEMVTNVSRW